MSTRSRANPNRSAGFTLIELIVVVVIIVILAGILIAALSGARSRAYNVATQALLANLSTDCESYFTAFDAYPGPVIPDKTSGRNGSTAKISGTQNLLLGLTFPVYSSDGGYYTISGSSAPTPQTVNGNKAPTPSGYSTPWIPVSDDANSRVNVMDMTGPLNFAQNPPRNYTPFYAPGAKELSRPNSPGVWAQGGVTGSDTSTVGAAGGWVFPTLVDRYPEAMPILYYRRTPNVDGTAIASTNAEGVVIIDPNPATQKIVSLNSLTTRPYYLGDNVEYTNSKQLQSSVGTIFDETQGGGNAFGPTDLTACVANNSLTGGTNFNLSARGGYVLISAGYDHLYGKNQKTSKNDDIVVVGGH